MFMSVLNGFNLRRFRSLSILNFDGLYLGTVNFVGGIMSYLRSLCLFTYSAVRPTDIVLCFSFACLRLLYYMLPVSLDCPFVIFPSVFYNIYFNSK
jgi:hypothetical protein